MTWAMPSVPDGDAEAGCRGLKLLESHWRWKRDLPVSRITASLQAWARQDPAKRPAFGEVVEVAVARRWPDSGRVAEVAIRHRVDRRERTAVLPAHDFRMAVGPGVVRSTWWDRCVMAVGKGEPVLVLQGRGFGHGVGLSQVSAWAMARAGEGHEAILARFYPGARVVDRY